MNNILVTGASGYLGGRVLDLLRSRGIKVTGTARNHKGLISCDLTNRQEVSGLAKRLRAGTVIHCAAKVPKSEKEYNLGGYRSTNTSMVANLIGGGFSHIIFISSMTVYSEDVEMPVKEEDVASRLTGYAAGKREAELMLLQAEGEVRSTILRLPGIFGPPRRSGLLYNATYSYVTGNPFSLPEKLPLWAGMHVEDAADMCIRAVNTLDETSLILNVGYPGRMSIPMAVELIARKCGKTIDKLPETLDFEMDLCRMSKVLGLPQKGFSVRIDELIEWVKADSNIGKGLTSHSLNHA